MTERRSFLSAAALAAGAVAGGAVAGGATRAQPLEPRPLAGRRALVTGAARGIGRAAAVELARRGADVMLLDIANPAALGGLLGYPLASRAELDEAVERVREQGVMSVGIATDVRERAAMEAALQRMVDGMGGVDILVANAGIRLDQRLEAISPEAWRAQFEVNVTGTLNSLLAALPALRRSLAGRVVITTALEGRAGAARASAYAASQWALTGLMKSWAAELAPLRIAVNAVAPAAVETVPFRAAGRAPETGDPMGAGPLDAREVARAIAFLAGPEAAFISGVTLDVNAGRSGGLTG